MCPVFSCFGRPVTPFARLQVETGTIRSSGGTVLTNICLVRPLVSSLCVQCSLVLAGQPRRSHVLQVELVMMLDLMHNSVLLESVFSFTHCFKLYLWLHFLGAQC